MRRQSVTVLILAASLATASPGTAGDFNSPSAAPLDGSFRSGRLALELNRFNLALRAGGGGSGGGIDEYQQSAAYQNVIWIPLQDIGDGNSITVVVGDSSQSADGTTLNQTNTVAGCSTQILNGPTECDQR